MPTMPPRLARLRAWAPNTLPELPGFVRGGFPPAFDFTLGVDAACAHVGHPNPDEELELEAWSVCLEQAAVLGLKANQARIGSPFDFKAPATGGDWMLYWSDIAQGLEAWIQTYEELDGEGSAFAAARVLHSLFRHARGKAPNERIPVVFYTAALRWICGSGPLLLAGDELDVREPARSRACGALGQMESICGYEPGQAADAALACVEAALGSWLNRHAAHLQRQAEAEADESARTVVELVNELQEAAATLAEDQDAPAAVRVLQARLEAAVTGYQSELVGLDPAGGPEGARMFVQSMTSRELLLLASAAAVELDARGLERDPQLGGRPDVAEYRRILDAAHSCWNRIRKDRQLGHDEEIGATHVQIRVGGTGYLQAVAKGGEDDA